MFKEGITYCRDYTVFRFKDREYAVCNKNEVKEDGTKLFTFNEAVEHCNKLEEKYLPDIVERRNLLKDWCRWRGYIVHSSGVAYWCDNDDVLIGKEFSEAFNLPFDGYSLHFEDYVNSKNTYGYYWSNTPRADTSDNTHYFSLGSDSIYSTDYDYNDNKFSVRCFVDIKVISKPYLFIDGE